MVELKNVNVYYLIQQIKSKKGLVAIFVGVIAFLYQTQVSTSLWVTTKNVSLKAKVEDTFDFVMTTDYMSKWFPFVSRVQEADGKPLGLDKKYFAIYDLPLWGEHKVLFKVVDHEPLQHLVIESESLFKPRVEFRFSPLEVTKTKFSISFTFKRLSYLFQYLLAPFLHFITSQKLQHSLFMLRMVFPY